MTFKELVKIMVRADIDLLERQMSGRIELEKEHEGDFGFG